jgi:hypothetical protein
MLIRWTERNEWLLYFNCFHCLVESRAEHGRRDKI